MRNKNSDLQVKTLKIAIFFVVFFLTKYGLSVTLYSDISTRVD